MDEVYGMHRRTRDRTRIRAHDPMEIRYWATSLCCTQAELRRALDAVGSNADAVRQYLGGGPNCLAGLASNGTGHLAKVPCRLWTGEWRQCPVGNCIAV